MNFIIRGQKLELTDSIKSYVKQKIGKLDKYFNSPNEVTANVVTKIRGNDQVVEVTIQTNKAILRAEESNDDLYASIDLVSDKLERQIRKNKTKMQNKKFKNNYEEFSFSDEEPVEEEKNVIVKRKTLDLKPMSEEEAVLQMDLIGHDFYIFKSDITNTINVVYRRKDGNYGIIDTK